MERRGFTAHVHHEDFYPEEEVEGDKAAVGLYPDRNFFLSLGNFSSSDRATAKVTVNGWPMGIAGVQQGSGILLAKYFPTMESATPLRLEWLGAAGRRYFAKITIEVFFQEVTLLDKKHFGEKYKTQLLPEFKKGVYTPGKIPAAAVATAEWPVIHPTIDPDTGLPEEPLRLTFVCLPKREQQPAVSRPNHGMMF